MDKTSRFIPFGFQYYRFPTPNCTEWDSDLKQIAAMGFNSVKYWVQWRASNPKEGVYVFDDIQELMDLAHKYNLKVILNVIFDVAPAWFYIKYPECKMIAADGNVVEPDVISCRQIGGAPGPCYHHDEAAICKDEFLIETVNKFKSHPAMFIWDLWNEPELTTTFKRTLSFENQVCYCSNSYNKFYRWLESKYFTIEKLNEKWQRNYECWCQVEAPRGPATFNDFIDWRLFMKDTVTGEMKRRAATVKALDLDNPVMCHTVPFPIFNLITAGSDDFELAEPCDLFGNSLGSSAWAADFLISAAKGKKLINSEIHAMPGTTALKPIKLGWKTLKKHILIPLARGITGFLFWQYRPEILGLEAPGWGHTYLDGSPTPWLHDTAKLNNIIQGNCNKLIKGSRKSDGISIFVSAEGQIANFEMFGHLKVFNDSLQGIHKLLHDLNYKVEFIHEKDVNSESLSEIKCLWMPFPIYLNEKICKIIKDWIFEGGILISECSFGMIQAEKGYHSIKIPAYGFDIVFGIEEKWISSVEQLDHSYHNATLSNNKKFISMTYQDEDTTSILHGSYFQTEIEVSANVTILAEFTNDSTAAITCNQYGNGKALWIGTLLGAAYLNSQEHETKIFIKNILYDFKLKPFIDTNIENVRVDILEYGVLEALIFVENNSNIEKTVEIKTLKGIPESIESWFIEGEAFIENGCMSVKLQEGDIQVFDCKYKKE